MNNIFFWKRLSKQQKLYFQLIIGGILVVLIPLVVASLQTPNKASAAWYDDNWAYRKAITITVASSSSDTINVNTLIQLDTSTLISGGKLQSSCQDLRFTNQAGKLLKYYVDEGCNTTSTGIVVQIDLVPKSTTTYTIYLYYGNPAAPSVSDSSLSGVFNGLSQGLVGYWSMNETSWNGTASEVKDLSGNGNNGAAVGNAAITSSGKYGNAGTFDGNGDYINNSVTLTNIPTGNTNYTISAWIYANAGGGEGIVGWGNYGTSNAVNALRLISTTSFRHYWWGNDLDVDVGVNMTGGWHHVLVKFDGTTRSLYFDGVSKGSDEPSNHNVPNTNSFRIGSTNGGEYFPGKIDDLRIYNRALSPTEITNLYNNPGTIATSTISQASTSTSFATEEKGPGPLAYWRFDDASGTSANDSTTNNNTGTLAGSTKPTWQTDDVCVSGKCLYFNGITASVTVAKTVSNVQTVSFWAYPMASNSASLATLNSTTDIRADSGVVSAPGTTSPIIYVNGIANAALTANTWQMVTLTTDTAIDASTVKIGQAPTGIFKGFIDEVKMYNYTRTAAQIKADYSARGNSKGVSAVLGSASSDSDANLSNGLTGYWKFDNNTGTSVTDYSGYGQTLTIRTRSINPTNWTTGKFGNAYQDLGYNYSNDEMASSSWRAPVQTDFTVSLWASPSATTHSTGGFIAARWWQDCSVSYQPGWQIGYTVATRKITYKIAADSCGPDKTLNSNAALPLQTWTHIVITHKTGDSIKIYINGALDNSVAYTGGLNPTPPQLSFGCGANNNDCGYPGLTDEARIYNRALSAAEVLQLYNYVPPPIPAASWSFEDGGGASVTDKSGNTNTGTWSGSGSHWVSGKYGKAANFNGTNDYISGGNGSSLQIIRNITLSAWVKLNSTSSNQDIIAKRGAAGQWGYRLWVDSTGAPQFDISNDGTTMATVSATTTLSPNTWYHLTGVYNRDSSLTVYINGVLDNTNTTIPGVIKNSTANVNIGGENSGASNLFNGVIDEAKIYNMALTQKQIIAEINAGHPSVGSPVGSALLHLNFDDGFGNVASNSGNIGAAGNAGLYNMASPATVVSGWNQSGKFGRALQFDGSNDFANAGNTSALQLTSGTVTAWIKTSNAGTSYRGIVTKQNAYGMFLKDNVFMIYDWTAATDRSTGINLGNNAWHYVAFTFQSGVTNGTILYIDGLSKLTTTMTVSNQTVPVLVGAGSVTPTQLFAGTIDEVKVYSYALTADEVKVDMNRGSALVLGSMSDTSGLSGGSVASNSASAAYCIPGDTATCTTPVAEWNFSERYGSTVNDTSGNGYNGTWSGTGNHWTTGKEGPGGNFNGSDDYVDAGTLGSLGSSMGSPITLSFWMKWNGGADTAIKQVIGTLNTGTTTGIAVDLNRNSALSNEANATNFYLRDESGDELSGHIESSKVYDGNWHYLTFVSNPSAATHAIYLDGVSQTVNYDAVARKDIINNPANFGYNFYLGALNGRGTASNYAPVSLDQVRIFNYARTASQIAWDYNRGGPVGHWRFDECQGTLAYDSSGNNNTGTITIGTGAGDGQQDSVGTCTASASTAWYNGATGKYNTSLNFDGIDDYVEAPHSSSNDLKNATGITLSGWIKSNSSASQGILGKWDGSVGGGRQYNFGVTLVNSNMYATMGVSGSGTNRATRRGDTVLATGQWYHIVAIWKNDATMQIYVNGIAQTLTDVSSSESIPTALNGSSSRNLCIGTTNNANSNTCATNTQSTNGQLDDVRIYNYALNSLQIKQLLNENSAVRFGPLTGSP